MAKEPEMKQDQDTGYYSSNWVHIFFKKALASLTNLFHARQGRGPKTIYPVPG